MKTYDAISKMMNEFSSSETFLGKFIGIEESDNGLGLLHKKAIFEKETLSCWLRKSDIEEENKSSFVRKVERNEEHKFTIYQRIYLGDAFHCTDLIIEFDDKDFGFIKFLNYLEEDPRFYQEP